MRSALFRVAVAALAIGSLGLSVGAKLYPVILVPIMAVGAWRGWSIRWSIGWTCTALLVAAIALTPMLGGSQIVRW